MRKMLLLIGALIITGASFGQLTGIRNIGSAGPNDYPTIAAAIADLNLMGVGPGGVTFNVAAGYTETFLTPAAGILTASGSQSNPVVFQKSPSTVGANPVITSAAGTGSSDGIIKIAGGDYITFDGIDVTDNPANTTTTTMMEYGYSLFKARNTLPVDGCQYVTIQNCAISLKVANSASVGIYSANQTASGSTIPGASIMAASDMMNNCKFYNNVISNVCKGINLFGYNDGNGVLFDRDNEIGTVSAGNTITLTGPATTIFYGVQGVNQYNLKIAYNTVTGGGTTANFSALSTATNGYSEIHHNTVSITAPSNATGSVYGIDMGAAAFNTAQSIHDNRVENCSIAGSASFTGVYAANTGGTVIDIYSNVVTGNTLTTGSFMGVGSGSATMNNTYNNAIYNNTKTGAGTMTCLQSGSNSFSVHDNQIYANNIVTSGTVTNASIITGIRGANANSPIDERYYNNMIYDLNITGSTTSATNTIYGIQSSLTSATTKNWYNNSVHNLAISAPGGSGTVYGFNSGDCGLANIYRNEIFNLSASNSAGLVHGIYLSQSSGTSKVNLNNNLVSDLNAPASNLINAVNGITIASGTNVGAYYNTVYLNASSSASTFGTSGIYKSGATTMTDLRNNVIMNLSSPGSAGGLTVAYRWSGTYNASYYAAASNANNFYAGTPSANHLVFYDGTNSDQTIAAFQSRVSPKDALSFTENSPLMNAASAPYDLHMNTTVGTLCESGGVPVLSPAITDDFDGNARTSTPDVGADEFSGMTLGVVNPTGFAPVVMSSRQIDLPFTQNLSGNLVAIVWNTTGYFTAPSGPVPALNSSFAGGTLLSAGTTSPVSHSGLSGGTTYYYKAFSYDGSTWSSGVPAFATTLIAPPATFNAYAMSTSRIDQVWTRNVLNNDVIVAVNSSNTFGQPVNGTTYAAGNALPSGGTVIYAGPLSSFSQTGLPASTRYYYKAWSVDAYAWYSNTGLTGNATTMTCEPTANLPFTENFDSYTPPAIGCGTTIDGNGDGVVWGSFTVTASTAHSGTKVLSLAASGTSVVSDDWYFIRGLNLVEGQKYQLSFYYRAQYTDPASNFEVKWGTSPSPSGMFSPALFTIATPNNFNPYPSATCIVTAPASGTYYFGWHATNNPYANIYIDDISVTTTTCVSPLTVSAGTVTATTADISWTGDAPNVQIDYGTVGHAAGAGTVISATANPQTISALTPSTSYDVYVRKDCGLNSYSFWTGPVTFTTQYLAPEVTTDAATSLTGSVATLNGTVNANGVSTQAYFEYGLTTSYGFNATSTPATITGTAATTVAATITGLIANGTTYHYRAVAYRGGIYTYGADQTFITNQAAPIVATLAITGLSSTGATLNGTVIANNDLTTVGFDYGTTTAYELGSVVASPSPVGGSFTTAVSASLTGLTGGTTYHYRVTGTNLSGTSVGTDMSFTAADAPTSITGGYAWTAASSNGTLVLNGTVNANDYSTTVTFQYGLTTAYGTTVNGVPATVTGTTATNVATANLTISGSNLNNTIHYRVVAVNSAGTTYGSDMVLTTPIAPLATTTAATFPVGGLTLNGTVNANNSGTTVIYEYGPTTSYGSTAAFPTNPVTGTNSSNRATIVTGLTSGATYHYRVTATNAAGTTNGTDMSVVVPALPTATTNPATLVTATGAKLNGTVVTLTTPAVSTTYRYEYGLTTAYGTIVTPTPNTGSTNGTFSPTIVLTGLIPNTTYHYRVYATNAAGTVYGADMSFTTLGVVPTVTTLAAFAVTPGGVTLNGTINANNSSADAGFEYGLDNTYGSVATAIQSPISGVTVTGISVPVTGLLPNTVYHYRATGTNTTGTGNGLDMTFTTLPLLPEVVTTGASAVTHEAATLSGTVNANSTNTTVYFEYGLTTGYGSTTVAIESPVTGNTATTVSASLAGLYNNSVYHFRAVGVNAAGTSYGNDFTFHTLPFALTGIKNIPGTGGPNDYFSIAAAIADLNLMGVGPGGVTFNVAAGYTETFQTPTAGMITATGTAANPVVFQKSGMGSDPVITAGVGTTTNVDGIIKIAGGDYFTFDGIDLIENPANTTATTQMEWGYALLKARNSFPVNGCQNVTIKNCAISLNGSNTASCGIYSGNHIATTTTPAPNGTVYNTSDYMNNCTFYGNTISNVYKGFNLNGYNDNLNYPPTSFDQNTEIGMAGAGNTITQSISNSSIGYGIWANYQTNLKIAYNTITGYNSLGAIYGITPRTSNSADIHHNTISVSGAAPSSGNTGIDLNGAGSPGYTSEIHDNLIQNCIQSSGGSFTAIYGGTAAPSVLNIYSNTITGNSTVGGAMTMIGLGGGGGDVNNIYDNLIYNNTKTGPGNLYGIFSVNYKNCNIHDNQFYSNNIATAGVVTAASTIIGIQSGQNFQTSETIYNNQIYDLNITGTTTATTNFIYGINTDIVSVSTRNWYNNLIHNLSISAASGSGTVIGMRAANGSTSNIYKNQVYNLNAGNAAGVVQGVLISSGTQVNVYNNFISDLQTPASSSANAVNGIAIAGGTNVGAYYNTVYLNASSSATTFGTAGIYKSGATTMTDLRNNVIMNLSTPGSAGGLTVALRWSGAYSSSYYSGASNSNNFYSGAPGSGNLIFYDGINSDQTFADYQLRVSPRDVLSFSENSPLMNTAVAPYDLHVNTGIGTLCESGGVSVTTPAITDDFDGDTRASKPDVGADEFGGITVGVVNPASVLAMVASSRQVTLSFQANPSGNNVVIVWNTTGYFTTPSGVPPAVNGTFAGGTLLYNGTSSPVNHTGLTGGTPYYYKAYSFTGTAYSSGVPVSITTNLTPPTGLTGSPVSTTQINLVWTKNALNNDVVVAVNSSNTFGDPLNGTTYTAGNALPTAGTVIYAGPMSGFSHEGLTINTRYYYKIWSVDTYAWYSVSGTTTNVSTITCSPGTVPYTENFNTYTLPTVGCGMVVDQNSDGVTWGTASYSQAHSSPYVLSISSGGTSNDDWYFARGLTLTTGTTYSISFWDRPSGTYPATNRYEVKWGPSPSASAMYAPALITVSQDPQFAAWNQRTCLITPTVSGTYYIGWHCFSDAGSVNLNLDDISVTTSTCTPPPAAVTVNSITATTADIGWSGDAPDVQIDYGTVGHAAGAGTVISATANPQTISALTPSTTYDVYVRKDCGLNSFSFWTGPVTFTTQYLAPDVTTDAATSLTGSVATLNGTVNANGVSTQAYFEYGLTTSYGFNATATPATITGTAATTVASTITGLIANGTTYHYRAVAYRGGIYTYGADQTFITNQAAPIVTTMAITGLSSTGATLNGTVLANNDLATVGFDYGTTTAYELGSVVASPSPVGGSSTTAVSAPITGLTGGITYHYRVTGTNLSGTSVGTDMSFTAADAPTSITGGYAWTAASSNGTLVLNGTVNANDYSTTVTFQYGLTTAYGTTVNAVPATVTGTTATNVATANLTISGSSLNNTLHYRVVAVNSAGTTYGSDMILTTPIAPLATTTAATFPVGGLTLNGTVNANNSGTTVIYEYGPTTAYGSTAAFPTNPVTGTSSSNRATIVTGLTPGATYHYRVTATNAVGTTNGADMSVVVPALPTATTNPATLVTATGAKLNGTVVTLTTPAVATTYRYEYGLTTAYGTIVTPTPNTGSTNGTFSPTIVLTGLIPNTTYHYRVYATNAAGTVYGADMSFTTLGVVPTVTTLAAFAMTPNGVTLNGTINANNSSAAAGFEYGLDNTYGSVATAIQSPISGVTVTGISVPVTGLLPNTVYHYRATGSNTTGTANGADMTFTTLSLLPEVTTTAATIISTSGATLNGFVNANNASTTAGFEYGLTTGYGSAVSATPSPVSGNVATVTSAGITGLLPNTLYHYRVSGTNAGGTSYGADMTFTTPEFDLNFTATPVQPLCYGGTGSVVLGTPTGGTPPYTFDPGNPPVTGLFPGSYTYSVFDATGLQATATAVINAAPAQLVLEATATHHPECFGDETGSVSLNTTGGTPGYTYDPMNPPLSGLPGGTYTYWVSDANGCQTSATVTIDPAPLLVVNNPGMCYPGTVNLTSPAVTAGSFLYGAALSYWVDANATISLSNPTSVGTGTYYIKATLNTACFDIKPVTATIHPLPVRYYATGGGSYCAGGSGVLVGLEGSQPGVNYSLWNYDGQLTSPIPGTGGPLSFGLQTTAGPILVYAENATTGCTNWMYNTLTITINQPVPVSVTITASSNPSVTGQVVTFTAFPVNGGYYPVYQWIVNGSTVVGATGAAYSYEPLDGDVVSCVLTSAMACVTGSPAASNAVSMTVTTVPASIHVSGTVANGENTCYNATQTITVAGGGTTFMVMAGGSATMIAGQHIIYLPGTTVQEGGYMHGYITTDFQYCGQQAPAIPSSVTGTEDPFRQIQGSLFTLYPNPTSGNFTLVMKGDEEYGDVKIAVYSMNGAQVLTEIMIGQKQEFRFADMPHGLYFVKVIADDHVETMKLVKL